MGPYLPGILEVTQQLFQNNEDQAVAGYSLEIWNTLFEEEAFNNSDLLSQQKANLILNSEWPKLAELFLNGL